MNTAGHRPVLRSFWNDLEKYETTSHALVCSQLSKTGFYPATPDAGKSLGTDGILWHGWGGLSTRQSRVLAGRAPRHRYWAELSALGTLHVLWSEAETLLRETFLAQRQHWSKISHVLKEALICEVSCKVIGLLPEEWLQNKTLCLLYISLFFAVTVFLYTVIVTTGRSFRFGIRIHLLPIFPHTKSVKWKFR